MERFIDMRVDLTGDKELIKTLKRLEAKTLRKVVRRATGLSMTPVKRDAKKRIHNRTGALKRSISKKTKTYTNTRTVISLIGAKAGYKEMSNRYGKVVPANYEHLVEFGHRLVKGGKASKLSSESYMKLYKGDLSELYSGNSKEGPSGGRVIGWVPAHPFMRPALRTNKHKIISKFKKETWTGIVRLAKGREVATAERKLND